MRAVAQFVSVRKSPPMHDHVVPVVAVPARNEEVLLPRLVDALARQTAIASFPAPLRVVVVLNNTDDGSKMAASEAAEHAEGLLLSVVSVVLPHDRAHVGTARRLAMDIAARAAPSGVILTTDADAVPNDDWVEQNLRAVHAGADIVGGRIVGDPQEEARLGPGFLRRARANSRYDALCDELASLIDPIAHDPWPRHRDHTGASLAVRSGVYTRVGGMDPLPFREDRAFVSKVVAAGYRLSHPLDVAVTVSARTCGRAPGGMADCLRNWLREEAAGIPLLFECPRRIEDRLRLRRAIRNFEGMAPSAVRRMMRQWGLDLGGVGRDIPPMSPAELIERFAADDPDVTGTVPAAIAIAALEQRLMMLKGVSDAA